MKLTNTLKSSILLTMLIVLSLVNHAAHAESAAPQISIRALSVESIEGKLTVDSGMVMNQCGLEVGKVITGDDIQEAIRQLWKLKLFSDISIVKTDELKDKWDLVIRVREYPRLEEWTMTGIKKSKQEEIREKVKLNRGQTLRESDIFDAEQVIREYYRTEGFLRASVVTEVSEGGLPTTRRVKMKIQPGEKVKVKRIDFVTVDGSDLPVKASKLRGQMKETKQVNLFRSGKFDENEFSKDRELVLEYLRNNGYRDARLLADSLWYSENQKHLFIRMKLDPGPLFYFGNVALEGNRRFDSTELLSKVNIRRGDKFSQEKLDFGVLEAIRGWYLDKGFLASQIEPVMHPVTNSPKVDTLNIVVNITENSEFSIRRIDIEGNTKTKEKVIRREIVQLPGETFDRSKIQRSIRELTILNFFGQVDPQIRPAGENEVDITFNMEEKQTDQANMQVGYSQRDGMIGAIGFTMPNTMGNGQRFVFDWSFGSYYRNFSISFDEPYLAYPQTSVGSSVFSMRRGGSTYGYDQNVYGGSLRFGRKLTLPDDYFRLNYSYRIERSVYSNFTPEFRASNPRDVQEDKPRVSSSLTQVISRDSRDNPEFPTNGSVQTWSATLAGGLLGGKDRYHKHVISSEWYIPAAWKFVLYSSSEIGILNGFSTDPASIPYLDYFFMGGAGLSIGVPLRGYNERAIGPQTLSGDYAIGGKSYFKQAFEIRFPIVPNPTIYGLMFAEAGNVWLTPLDLNPSDLKRSMGMGVRIYMPLVGLIGLDYAYGFDNTNFRGDRRGEWMPHFQFGRGF